MSLQRGRVKPPRAASSVIKKYVNWNRPVKKIKKEEEMGRRVEALESTLSLLKEEKECLCVVETTEVMSLTSGRLHVEKTGDSSQP